jgi:hypothetical protein
VTTVPATFSVVWAHAAREQDDRDRAGKAFERALEGGLLDLPHGPTWTISLTWAADICAWLEDRPRAARLYDLLAPFTDVMTYQYGPVGRAVGRLAQTLERQDDAEQLLRDAVALCERMDARAFLAMARQDLGELLLPSPEGRQLLEQARAAANNSACRASPRGQSPRTSSECLARARLLLARARAQSPRRPLRKTRRPPR